MLNRLLRLGTATLPLISLLFTIVSQTWVPLAIIHNIALLSALLAVPLAHNNRYIKGTAIIAALVATKKRYAKTTYEEIEIASIGEIKWNSAKLKIRWRGEEIKLKVWKADTQQEENEETSKVMHARLSPNNDYTATVQVTDLEPNALYNYEWQTITKRNVFPTRNFRFKTLQKDPTRTKFVFGSCWKAGFPAHDPLRVLRFIEAEDPDMVLHLGDIIYSDQPHHSGYELENYRRHYRQLLSATGYERLFSRIPMYTMYDDHEIKNNWSSNHSSPFPTAFKVWNDYFGKGNPSPIRKDEAYYTFEIGNAAAFFVLDTRKFRSESALPKNDTTKTMLGSEQFDDLVLWLRTVQDTHTFKIIASPDPLTIQWADHDLWYGCQVERQRLLEYIKSIKNVIFLSGDRHQSLVTKFEDYGAHEFSISPFNQFTFPVNILNNNPDIYNKTVDKRLFYLHADGIFCITMFGVMEINTDSEPATLDFRLMTASSFGDVKEYWKYRILAE